MKKKIQYLDVLRVLAVLLVMWGHFVGVATNATQIYGVINGTMSHPIIPSTTHSLWRAEALLYFHLHTQFAILGVILFFIITGYLMPLMLERYSPRDFLINRFFRIFPTLAVCMLLIGGFVFCTQGITFKPLSYVVSITLLFYLIPVGGIVGILWTLTVEVIFYIITAFMKKFTVEKVFLLYGIILFSVVIVQKFPAQQFANFVYFLKFCGFILIGSAIYMAEHTENKRTGIIVILASVMMTFSILRTNRQFYGDDTTYPNIMSIVIALSIFSFAYLLQKKKGEFFNRLPKFVYLLADMVYSLYLTHVVFGLTVMYYLAQKGVNAYLVVLGGFISSIFVAYVIMYVVEKPSIKKGREWIELLNDSRRQVILQDHID